MGLLQGGRGRLIEVAELGRLTQVTNIAFV